LSEQHDSGPAPRDARAAYFGRLAATYGEGEYYGRRRAAVVAAIAPELRAARRILDLGCGPGAYLMDIVGQCRDALIVGADLTREMTIEARRRAGKAARIVQADAASLPFKDRSLDLVFGSHVLPFVADLDRCVSGIARCLRPGGVLVATVEAGSFGARLRELIPPDAWEQFARVVFGRETGARFERGPRRDEQAYREACARAGLPTESRAVSFSVTWADFAEWVRIRWVPVAGEAQRGEIEAILARLGANAAVASRRFEHQEGLLLARKPGDAGAARPV
jgi:SAM-dependent methyltransferase